jgi:hypothetical protein
MSSRKSPGRDQLGHSPFGKEKLEGPKVHHDDHGSDASNPMKGTARAIPGQHWELSYDPVVYHNNRYVKGAEFNPKCSDERKVTYRPINREDH